MPSALSLVDVGWRYVPFSGRRGRKASIVSTADQTEKRDIPLKDILAVIDDESWFTPRLKAAKVTRHSTFVRSLRWSAPLYARQERSEESRFGMRRRMMKKGMLCFCAACRSVYDCLCRKGTKKNGTKEKLPAFEDDLDHVLEKIASASFDLQEYEATKREVARYYEEYLSWQGAFCGYAVLSAQTRAEKLLRFHMKKRARRRGWRSETAHFV